MSDFKKKLVKFYFTVKGLRKRVFLRKGCVYTSDKIPDNRNVIRRYYYRGNNTFFITTQGLERTYGVEFFDSKLHTYKNWELGILDFKLDNNAEIVN